MINLENQNTMKAKLYFIILTLLILSCQKDNKTNEIQSLIAYYPFNGNVNDFSGFENNGVLHGIFMTYDRFDSLSAYYFDGLNDYVEI